MATESTLHSIAKVIALIFAIPLIPLFLFGVAFVGTNFGKNDLAFEIFMLIYLVGLFLGRKFPLIGGILCLGFPIFNIIWTFSYIDTTQTKGFTTIAQFCILLIPAILYIVSGSLSIMKNNMK